MGYATVAQLEAWTGTTAPADAERLLERASDLVDSRVTAWYLTDNDGNPSDADVIEALMEATAAQVEFWLTGGGETDDILGPAAASTVGPLNISETHIDRLAPRTIDRLRRAGLLTAANSQTAEPVF